MTKFAFPPIEELTPPEQLATAGVILWVLDRELISRSTVKWLVLAASVVLVFSGMFPLALFIQIIFFVYYFVDFNLEMATVETVLSVLAHELKEIPDALQDPVLTSRILAAADIPVWGNRRREKKLREFAREITGPDSEFGTFECQQGHALLCGHKVTGVDRQFWVAVGHEYEKVAHKH